jgi:transposase-like protein
MSTLARKARSGARRARRTLVRWAAASELRELEATRTKLRRTRAQLRDARAKLAQATYDLPPDVEEAIERARA